MNERKVSICVPTYNYAAFVGQAVSSACAQTYANVEIIVSDNCSTDDTERLVKELAARDSRVRYSRNDRNMGMQANFNRCLELASGEYVKFLCADDVLTSDCVARMVEVLQSRQDVTLVACRRERLDATARRIGHAGYAKRGLIEPGMEALRRCFFHGNLIGEPTAVMFRKEHAGRGFSESYSQLVDLEMWFHLLRKGAFQFLPEPLCGIREHADQATGENVRWGAVLEDKRRLFHAFHAEAARRASLADRTMWDARMAVTVRRTTNAGHAVAPAEIEEVFFPRLFRALTYPVASALWNAGVRRP